MIFLKDVFSTLIVKIICKKNIKFSKLAKLENLTRKRSLEKNASLFSKGLFNKMGGQKNAHGSRSFYLEYLRLPCMTLKIKETIKIEIENFNYFYISDLIG